MDAFIIVRLLFICLLGGGLVTVFGESDENLQDNNVWVDIPPETKNDKSGRPGTAKPCPSEKLVNCLLNPCDVEYCPKYPLALCRMNNCGSCKAEFSFEPNGKALTDCGKKCNEACPRNYDPVCGSDKKTYGNLCMLNVARCLSKGDIKFMHMEECDTSTEF